MKFITLAAVVIGPLALVASAEHSENPVHPILSASKDKGNLYVKLNNAKGLTNKNWIFTADPFVEMYLEKSYKHRSKVRPWIPQRGRLSRC